MGVPEHEPSDDVQPAQSHAPYSCRQAAHVVAEGVPPHVSHVFRISLQSMPASPQSSSTRH
jgi:hypothetical protein